MAGCPAWRFALQRFLSPKLFSQNATYATQLSMLIKLKLIIINVN